MERNPLIPFDMYQLARYTLSDVDDVLELEKLNLYQVRLTIQTPYCVYFHF